MTPHIFAFGGKGWVKIHFNQIVNLVKISRKMHICCFHFKAINRLIPFLSLLVIIKPKSCFAIV